jgi:hypothetical protein
MNSIRWCQLKVLPLNNRLIEFSVSTDSEYNGQSFWQCITVPQVIARTETRNFILTKLISIRQSDFRTSNVTPINQTIFDFENRLKHFYKEHAFHLCGLMAFYNCSNYYHYHTINCWNGTKYKSAIYQSWTA